MRILIIGIVAFLTWSAFATYIYVCKIKGLCVEPPALQTGAVTPGNITATDTIRKPVIPEQDSPPGDLIIYFGFDKSEFTSNPAAEKFTAESGKFLDKNPKARISVTGYTDAIGSDEYNNALGYRRAQRMKRYFEDKGIPGNNIKIESKGETDPAADNNTETGRSNNRRTAITIQK